MFLDFSVESEGSEEESGKDWDELEEEARKGSYTRKRNAPWVLMMKDLIIKDLLMKDLMMKDLSIKDLLM